MATARYWRVVGVVTYAGHDLAISKLRIQTTGNSVLTGSVVTSSHAPVGGSLSSLVDDSEPGTVRFAQADVRAAGFWIAFDLGSAYAVFDLQVGAALLEAEFLQYCDIQYFDGAAWKTEKTIGRFLFPGAFLTTTLETPSWGDLHAANVALLLSGTDYTDASPSARTLTASGAVSVVSTPEGDSLAFAGGGLYGSASGLALPGDFTIEFFAWSDILTVYGGVVSTTNDVSATNGWVVELSGRGLLFSYASKNILVASGVYAADGVPRHWAVTRWGSTLMAFKNGVVVGTSTYAGTIAASALTVGAWFPGADAYRGNVRGVRVTPGVCRYAAGFTPPLARDGYGSAGIRQSYSSKMLHATNIGVPKVAASSPLTAHNTHSPARLQLARDVEVGGPGTIYGTTKTKGTPNQPAKARVVLLHQRSKLPVRETWSDPITGAFAFTGIDTAQQFLTLAEDAAGNFRPVAASRLVPEVLP